MNEAGTAEASLILKPGQGYVVWIKSASQSTTWSYPNPLVKSSQVLP
jgi:hypothetical protein